MLSFFLFVNCVFCFKQKTAYEMRISDWSSDVCSSDLTVGRHELTAAFGGGIVIFESHFVLSLPLEAGRNIDRLAVDEGHDRLLDVVARTNLELGRASCRESVCQ